MTFWIAIAYVAINTVLGSDSMLIVRGNGCLGRKSAQNFVDLPLSVSRWLSGLR